MEKQTSGTDTTISEAPTVGLEVTEPKNEEATPITESNYIFIGVRPDQRHVVEDLKMYIATSTWGEQDDYKLLVIPPVIYNQLAQNARLSQLQEAERARALDEIQHQQKMGQAVEAIQNLWDRMVVFDKRSKWFGKEEMLFDVPELRTQLEKCDVKQSQAQLFELVDFLLLYNRILPLSVDGNIPRHKVRYKVVMDDENRLAQIQKLIDKHQEAITKHEEGLQVLQAKRKELNKAIKKAKKQKSNEKPPVGEASTADSTPPSAGHSPAQ
jgi:hypothetical protein